MLNPRLAFRYAKSLLDLAVEQGSLPSTLQDIEMLEGACRDSRELCNILRSPIINADKKEAIVNAIFGSRLQPLTMAFVTLLVSKGRESNLPEIASSFISQYKTMKRIRTVRLITATPLNDTVKEAIRSRVAAGMPDYSIELNEEVNPDLIGGFVLEMNDKLIDASVRRDLMDVRKQFLDKSYQMQLR